MKKIIAIAAVAIAISGCSQSAGRGAAIGAASGALIGGLATNSWEGAAIGAAVGGASGAVIGKATEPGKCVYRDRNGRQYIVFCCPRAFAACRRSTLIVRPSRPSTAEPGMEQGHAE